MPVSAVNQLIGSLQAGAGMFPALLFAAEAGSEAFAIDIKELPPDALTPPPPAVKPVAVPSARFWPVEMMFKRPGQPGRAGRNGLAISLVNHAEGMNVKRIERFTKQIIPVDVIEGFEPKRSAAPRPQKAGWKPGDNRGAKPGQRSFSKPGAPRRDAGAERQRRHGGDAETARPGARRRGFQLHDSLLQRM